jgi:hypothetical protein
MKIDNVINKKSCDKKLFYVKKKMRNITQTFIKNGNDFIHAT